MQTNKKYIVWILIIGVLIGASAMTASQVFATLTFTSDGVSSDQSVASTTFQGTALGNVSLNPSAKQSISGGYSLINSSTFMVATSGTPGIITNNHDNTVFSDFPQGVPVIQYAYPSGGNTTIYDLISATDPSSLTNDGRIIPLMSEVAISDIVVSDLGFYTPGDPELGFEMHIAPASTGIYPGRIGSFEFDPGRGINKMEITYVPSMFAYQFGSGFNPTSSSTSGNLVNGNIQAGSLMLTGTSTIIQTSFTPSTSSTVCTTGTISWDSGFVYVCVATNTWKRSALTTW